MGAIVFSGLACDRIVRKCKGATGEMEEKVIIPLYAVDLLCTIAAVVLGILAMLKILPLPVGMAEPFAYATLTAGALNGFFMIAATIFGSCR